MTNITSKNLTLDRIQDLREFVSSGVIDWPWDERDLDKALVELLDRRRHDEAEKQP